MGSSLPKREGTGKPSVTLTTTSDWIAIVTIDVPDSKVNTLSTKSMMELNEIVDRLASTRGLHGVIFCSGKQDSFIAGADVNEIRRIQGESEISAFRAAELGKELFSKIEKLPVNSVAAVNGICLGGGTELTLACKFRLASKNAKIGLPEIKLGFIPGWGGCLRLPRLLGLQTALDLILTGKVLDAKKAWRIGLVSEVVESDKLMERAREVALSGKARTAGPSVGRTMSSLLLEYNPLGRRVLYDQVYKMMMRATKGKYPAAKEALKVIFKGVQLPVDKASTLESATFARLAMTDVSRNLVGIFFAQNESKKLPAELSAEKRVQVIGVLGAGVMGAGIAQLAAKAGFKVVVKDIEEQFLEKGRKTIGGLFAKLVERGRMSRRDLERVMSEMRFTTRYEDLADCDLVIEAVLEDMDVKRRALAECEDAINKEFVFATNTSSLSVTGIADGARNRARVVGLHFFNPVHKMPLVEVVRGRETSEEALAVAMSVALKLDKTTVVTADSPGFVVNRILAPYLREAAVLAGEGVPIEDIDRAMKSFGMPMGPLALLDEVGLDIAGKVVHVMYEALGERMAPPALMSELDQLKLLGKKGGKGIYIYDDHGKPQGVNPQVSALIKVPPVKKYPTEIQDRLVLLMINEAARCLEESVVQDAAQLDLAMVFGTGFPPFLGGVLRYADQTGTNVILQKMDYMARVLGDRYAPSAPVRRLGEARGRFYEQHQPVSRALVV